MKWRTRFIAAILLVIVTFGSQIVFSQATPQATPQTIGPVTLTGLANDQLSATQSGGPNNVPFEQDPYPVHNVNFTISASVPTFDVQQTDPSSGCEGLFSTMPSYSFNLE